jgi:phospholipid transport system transporter-binding protein
MLPLPAQLTLDEAQATLCGLLREMAGQAGATIELDAAPLAQIDTSTLAVLLACQRSARQQGKALRVHGAPDRLRMLATLYGVQDLLALEPAPTA